MADKSIPESELSDLIKLARQALKESQELQRKIEQIYTRLFAIVEPPEIGANILGGVEDE